jgi:predicted glycosyltransferase
MVYSHDTFGLGNIRRMLEICKYLLKSIPELSILMVSGSPMLHSFRLPQGLDYVKLPCLNRGESGKISAKYLNTKTDETVKLRSDIILATVMNFKPDLFLVDKKPNGIEGELTDTIKYLKYELPETKLLLLLRDILDSPEVTIGEWEKNGYYDMTELFYDKLLVVGMPEVFDLGQEYKFSEKLLEKVHFCGYIRKEPGLKRRNVVREELQIQANEKFVLVTPGGGQDGYHLIKNYLVGLGEIPVANKFRSLIICGPEMEESQKQELYQMAAQYLDVHIREFTDDLMSCMDAADLVVSMGGYNTVTEILSLSKKAIVVPRVKPAKEQLIRAERLANLGLIKMIHPETLTPENLMETVVEQLSNSNSHLPAAARLDLDALPRITYYLENLLFGVKPDSFISRYQKYLQPCLSTAV